MLLLLFGCGGNAGNSQHNRSDQASSPAITLSAAPTAILSGSSATLTWSSTNATSVSIDNGIGKVSPSGSQTVAPTATTSYNATAQGPGGTAQASVTVTVNGQGGIQFTASATAIASGASTTLSVSAPGATSITLDHGLGTFQGDSITKQVNPTATTTYNATANFSGGVTLTASITITVEAPPPPTPVSGVLTYKNDNFRTGQNLNESVLTPANVNAAQFGKVFSYNVDGFIFAQPLYVRDIDIPGEGSHNVVYVATEHDSVYAFDADGKSGSPLWHVSFINPVDGITTIPTADVGSTIFPEIGITSTPVIDPSTGTIYVEASTKENGAYFHRLHALDIASGEEKFGGPVTIAGSVAGSGVGNDGNGRVPFQAKIELQRAALLLVNKAVYIAFASHGDNGPYHGWVFAYDATTLEQVGIWNDTPNGQDGGIWQSGGGLSADENGSVFGISGNGTAEGGPDFGDSFFRLTLNSSGISVADFFTPFNQKVLAADDNDLGSGGPLLLPDQAGSHPHLLTSAGKAGTIYLIDRDDMGGYNQVSDDVVQEIPNEVGLDGFTDNNFCTPSYWQGRVYYVGANDAVKAFTLNNGMLASTPASRSSHTFDKFSGTPAISASGTSNGILWLIDKAGALYAYDASNLATELYDTNQAGTRDTLGTAVKFTVPTVANGRVYVGTASKLVVYGLL
ncbi:MAG TPA: hypothetical protein VFJ47_08045 [Terriglobales bacterium]|nr:hypothetical protein [Terriglobales bacterium]